MSTNSKNAQSQEESIQRGDVILCEKLSNQGRLSYPRDLAKIPLKDRFSNLLALGAADTSDLFMPMIEQDLQNSECGVIVMDSYGILSQKTKTLAEQYGRPVVRFDPSMENCPYFNPLAGNEFTVVENLVTAFHMVSPETFAFGSEVPDQLIRNGIKVLKRLDENAGFDGVYSTLNQFNTLIRGGKQADEMLTEFAKMSSRSSDASSKGENVSISEWFMTCYLAEGSEVFEDTAGVRALVSKICSESMLRDILNPDPTKERPDGSKNSDGTVRMQLNDIDFDKALAEGQVLCISTAKTTYRSLSQFLAQFLSIRLQSAVFQRPGTEATRQAVFLYMDNFHTFATPDFVDLLVLSHQYRIASHLGIQSRSLMTNCNVKFESDFASAVSHNARNVVVLPFCNFEDAIYYSEEFSEQGLEFCLSDFNASDFGGVIIYRLSKNRFIQVAQKGVLCKPDADDDFDDSSNSFDFED